MEEKKEVNLAESESESILLEHSKKGIKIMLVSSKLDMRTLTKEAHKSFNFLLKSEQNKLIPSMVR